MKGKISKEVAIVAYTAYTDEEKNCKKAGMDYFCNFICVYHLLVPKPASLVQIAELLK